MKDKQKIYKKQKELQQNNEMLKFYQDQWSQNPNYQYSQHPNYRPILNSKANPIDIINKPIIDQKGLPFNKASGMIKVD